MPERRNLFVVAISIDVRFSPRLAELPSDSKYCIFQRKPTAVLISLEDLMTPPSSVIAYALISLKNSTSVIFEDEASVGASL